MVEIVLSCDLAIPNFLWPHQYFTFTKWKMTRCSMKMANEFKNVLDDAVKSLVSKEDKRVWIENN